MQGRKPSGSRPFLLCRGRHELDPETAVLDAPESADIEEQEPFEETEAPGAPQTEGEDGAPETEEPQHFTSEEVEARLEEERNRIKADYEAEQEKQRADAIAQYERQQFSEAQKKWQEARNGVAEQHVRALARWAYEQAEKGNELRLNPQVLGPIVEQLSSFAFMEEWHALDALVTDRLGKLAPDYRPPQNIASARQQAMFSQAPDRMVTATLDYVWDAAKAAVREDVKRELAEEQSEAAKTEAIKSAGEKRKASGPRPTVVGGTGSPRGNADLSTLDPRSTEYAREYERKYGFAP